MSDCIYIGIGNSDDKLSQAEWSDFVRDALEACQVAGTINGAWFSEPTARYQNGCFCIRQPKPAKEKWLRAQLANIALEYEQDAISWAEASTDLIRGKDAQEV